MKKKRLSTISISVCLVLTLLVISLMLACAAEAPAPAPAPAPKPAPAPAPASSPIPEYRLVASTAASGSSGHLTGSIMASMVTSKSGGRIKVSAIPTSGSYDAFNRVRTGEVDFTGVGTYPTLYQAFNSIGPFEGLPNLEVYPLIPMSRTVFQTIMLEDIPIETWNDLVGKKCAAGTPGSVGSRVFKWFLEVTNLTDKVDVVDLSFGAAADAIRDNKVDMGHFLTAAPNSIITELQTRHPIKMLDYTQDMLDKIQAKYYGNQSLFRLHKVTNKTYPNLVRDATLGSYLQPWSAPPNLPEDAAYWITKILWENREELAAAHPALTEINPETLAQMPRGFADFHPGALKYYKEQGLLN